MQLFSSRNVQHSSRNSDTEKASPWIFCRRGWRPSCWKLWGRNATTQGRSRSGGKSMTSRSSPGTPSPRRAGSARCRWSGIYSFCCFCCCWAPIWAYWAGFAPGSPARYFVLTFSIIFLGDAPLFEGLDLGHSVMCKAVKDRRRKKQSVQRDSNPWPFDHKAGVLPLRYHRGPCT